MKFHVVSLFPEMIEQALQAGVTGQSLKKSVFQLQTYNPRSYANDKHKSVDDRPFGGGAGMLMLADPLSRLVNEIKDNSPDLHRVYLSPRGKPWSDKLSRSWAKAKKNIALVCGRYEGVDQRWVNQNVDEEISIGDYVLSGGELGALVLIDSIVRHIPGVLGNPVSVETESFSDSLLEPPQFTRPALWNGESVPKVLLSGHHKNISSWNEAMSLIVTYLRRPDLIGDKIGLLPKAIDNVIGLMSTEELRVCGLDKTILEAKKDLILFEATNIKS